MYDPDKDNLQMIELSKIDETIIKPIRSVFCNSNSFKTLKTAILEDGQRHPIILRKLTPEELTNAKADAEFGILDGHHRYKILQDNNRNSIWAIVLPDTTSTDQSERRVEDVKTALRMNSAIPMSSIQKGKVIWALEQETGKSVAELGKELFGVAQSMAYRCVNSYKKYTNMQTIKKPRDNTFDFDLIEKLQSLLKNVPKSKTDIDTENVDKCLKQIESFKNLENSLHQIRNMLANQKAVKAELKRRKEKNATPTD